MEKESMAYKLTEIYQNSKYIDIHGERLIGVEHLIYELKSNKIEVEEIISLRKMCFSERNKAYKKLMTYLEFLLSDVGLKREVEYSFGGFDKENLYVQIY